MKIYFCGSIRAGRTDISLYSDIINHLKNYGEVLTEHVGDENTAAWGEDGLSDEYIHNRDLGWLLSSDVVVAEVTIPSLGVGYEIARAVENNKRTLCLYRPEEVKMLSAMIAGCPEITVKKYSNIDEAKKAIDDFFKV